MARDPRLDPKIGDCLQKGKWHRNVGPIDGRYVHYQRYCQTTGNVEGRGCYIGGWRRWAATAEVIHVEEQNG